MAFRMTFSCVLAFAMCMVADAALTAEQLQDPTRPPQASVARNVATATPAVQGDLRSIRSDANGRLALIDGARLRVGDTLGDARVKSIQEYAVVLSTPTGDRTLKLYPGVQKQAHQGRRAGEFPMAQADRRAQVKTTKETTP